MKKVIFVRKLAENIMEEPKYTFDMVWQMFAKTDKKFADTDKKIKEMSAEADKRSAEADKRSADTDKKIKELTRNIGGVSESMGRAAEEMIYNSLEKDMTFAGIDFYYIDRNKKRKIKSLNLEGEFDIVLTNGDTIAIIETKHQVRKRDVSKLATTQVDKFIKLFKEYENYNIVLGVGGVVFDSDAEQEAEENGVGVIKIINDKVEYFTDGIKYIKVEKQNNSANAPVY